MEKNKTALFLCRPYKFKLNEQTALDNKLQKQLHLDPDEINRRVLFEFDTLVKKLNQKKIETIVFQDTEIPETPDSIFPNNWFSTEANKLTLYPMKAKNRRAERNQNAIELIQNKLTEAKINDLSHYENEEQFLEGTGVLVFDHQAQLAYCALSQRAHHKLAKMHTQDINYDLFSFNTQDKNGQALYHTNVMLAVLEKHVVYCEDVIKTNEEKVELKKYITQSGKEALIVSYDQMMHFCCNILQVNEYVLMSTQAYEHFENNQLSTIALSGEIIHSELTTIETLGGGGCRCMLAEIFPTK